MIDSLNNDYISFGDWALLKWILTSWGLHELSSICSICDTCIVLCLHQLWGCCKVLVIPRLVQLTTVCSANTRTSLNQLTRRSTALAAYSIVVFDPGILQLSDLMELFESNQLLLEVFSIEVIVVIEPKDSIVFEFLLEELPNLGRR